MKTTTKQLIALTLALLCIVSIFSCGKENTDPWKTAVYTEDTTLGEGETTVKVIVKAGDKSVTFTLNTDKKTVKDALMEHNLLAGDEGEYGLYVKNVNGITADYNKDQFYWALYINGEYAMTGVDSTEISADTVYTLERTK